MWSIYFLCLVCIVSGFEEDDEAPLRVDPEVRAQLEAKVISSMSLKDIEAMVENDDKVVNAPKSGRIIVIPKGRNGDQGGDAYIIQRKPKASVSPQLTADYRYAPEGGFRQPSSRGSAPSLFLLGDLESSQSEPARRFYESIVDRVVMAASEGRPRYSERPRGGHGHGDEERDEDGCRTIYEKVVDPEDSGKRSREKEAKGYVIRKECESPDLNGPDAKIAEASPLRHQTSLYDDEAPSSYERTRPEELDSKKSDPIAPDYIDSMLEKHFKGFPLFSNSPLSSFRGYQERFKLRIPDAFRSIKPTVGVQSYEYSNPKSGFEEDEADESPRQQSYQTARDEPEYDEEDGKKSSDSKDPKMKKKSFAYYRKENPKTDPNDQQYAEEYAQGNFRSFSSSYDSEKDGPKKKKN